MYIDPKKPETFEFKGTKFIVRGLTDREKLSLLPQYMEISTTPREVTFSPKTVEAVLMVCLLGWENTQVQFNSRDQLDNLDKLSSEELFKCFSKVMELSRLSAEERKN